MNDWLTITRGDAPLIVSIPHAGTAIPDDVAAGLLSITLAQHDADFHVDRLYAFATGLGATIVGTAISRTVIDVNRDPSGASLYPGQATTGLCPRTTFDGVPLYRPGFTLDAAEIERRRARYFDPYHATLEAEIERLRARHPAIVLYDAHSIRSRVPHLFGGTLPQFNIGTNDGQSCDPALAAAIEARCGADSVTNGRFKGGWITRHYGAPDRGVHAIQMELAMRGYLDEDAPWPPHWDEVRAAPLQSTLAQALATCIAFARGTA